MKIWRRTAGYTLFDHTRNEEILEEMKVEPIGEKLRRRKNKLLTTCRKNGRQQDAKNNAELYSRPNGRRRLGRS